MNQTAAVTERLAAILHGLGAGWVMWLLIGLSVLSVAIMIERAFYFGRHSFGDVDDLVEQLAHGNFQAALDEVRGRVGLEAEVVRASLRAVERGPAAVEEIIEATIRRGRLRYERFLAVLNTQGNNAPFIGLLGTVLGIVDAFAVLAANAGQGTVNRGAGNIMAGISEALVATAIGLLVALPCVAVHNVFGRWLKTIVTRSECLGHALASHLKTR
ncbi:MAG TPA: MotA/TolQ/ExbB proton channel family protein [Polyangia bacterium]